MKTYLHRASNLKSTISGLCFIAEVYFWHPPKTVISCDLFILRESSSTHYVGLGYTAPPTNTNFWLTFFLPRLQEALYGDIPV